MAPDTTRKAEKKKPNVAQMISVVGIAISVTLYALSMAAMTAMTAWDEWQRGRIASAAIGAALLVAGVLAAVSFYAWVWSTTRE